ncbi:hypothetical protein GMMP15_1540010 [Candidatus Magnetomoraceae bacterium gMMP-15]
MKIDGISPEFGIKSEGIEDKKLKNTCAEFESFFIQEILKSARKSLPKNAFLGNSQGSETYNSMLDQEVASNIAKNQGFGLGELLYSQLKKED